MKFFVVGGLGVFAIVLLIVGAATSWSTGKGTNGPHVDLTAKYTFQKYKLCAKNTQTGEESCDEKTWSQLNDSYHSMCPKLVSMPGAAFAFVILSILGTLTGTAMAFAGISVETRDMPKIGGLVMGITAVMCLIGWSLTISLYTTNLCPEVKGFTSVKDDKSSTGNKLGESAPLQIVAMLFLIGGAVAGVVLPRTAPAGDSRYHAVGKNTLV